MAVVEFTIPGHIGGWSRARLGRLPNGKPMHFTPKKMRIAQDTVRFFAREAMVGKPMLRGPLFLSITIKRNHPKSWTKKRKAETRYVTGKPDTDNIAGNVFDSLNHIVFVDDSEIAAHSVWRIYCDDAPSVLINVIELEGVAA